MSVFSSLANQIVDFGTTKSNPRTEKITKITIHHMAVVNADPASVARGHRDGSQQASANYYIGSDGKIVGGVSEDRRAWTSGSSWNDQKAITFEVANCKGSPNWEISDAAYKAVIALSADICKRYGITPHFTGDANGTLTLHYMFQATACPGGYLKNLHQNGKIEKDIKAAMGGSNNEKIIWDYLLAHIGNEYGVAGLMGNMQAESGLKPNNLQNSYESKLGYTDETYTAAVDNGSYGNFVGDAAGYGLCQWTSSGRKNGLLNLKRQRGCSIADMTLQLDWLWHELTTSYKSVLSVLQTATSVRQASDVVLTRFEIPADQSESVKQRRASYGQTFYDKYAKGGSAVPYVVRITADELNVRSGAGTEYPIVTTVHEKEAFTIVEEDNGWGRLKSGVGWICLQYTERV